MTRRQIMFAFVGVMLAMFLAALDQTVVATALPRIVEDLKGFQHLSWVVTAYMLTATVTVPLYGKVSDLAGRRRVLMTAIAIFLAGSALSGLSRNMNQLIVFRGIQGLGAGGVMPIAMTVIGDLFSPRERGRYQGYTGGVFAAAAIVGPLLGGFLTDHVSWRWIFYVNLPVGALALFVIATEMHLPHVRREHSIDWLGAATLMAGVSSLLLAAVWGGASHPWGSAQVLGAIGLGVVLVGAFVAIERRSPEPLLPLGILREPTVANANIAGFLTGAGLFGVIIFVPTFIQGVIGSSATNSGVVLMPLMLGLIASSIAAGRIISRTGRYKIFPITGTVTALAGLWLLTRLGVESTNAQATVAMVVIGLGLGQMFQTYVLAVQNAVPREDLGVATASTQFFRSIGGTFGVAAFGTVLATRLRTEMFARLGPAARAIDPQRLLEAGARNSALAPETARAVRASLAASLHTVFMVGLPIVGLTIVTALLLPERTLRSEAHIHGVAEPEAAVARAPEPE